MARCGEIGDGWRDVRMGGGQLGRGHGPGELGHGDTDNRLAPGNGDFKRGTTLGNI